MSVNLLIANDGGHIAELHALVGRLPAADRTVWATIPTDQTRSLLEGADVRSMRASRPRDVVTAARNAARTWRLIREVRPDLVVSTGSSLAAAALPVSALHGIPTLYIESATRIDGPSLAGRIAAATPGVTTLTQQQHWDLPGWQYAGSVFDGFVHEGSPGPVAVRKLVVTVGTSAGFGFRRLVERLVRIVPPGVEVLWQTGSTDVSGLPVHVRASVPATELADAVREADAVVAHAGAGSSLGALQAGKSPLLVPRRRAHGEHVDDHQVQIADDLARRGLAHVVDADDVTWEHVEAAARCRVTRTEREVPLVW